jgi:hypothetical protein
LGGSAIAGEDVARVNDALGILRGDLSARSYDESVLGLIDSAAIRPGCPPPSASEAANRFLDPKTGTVKVIGAPTTRPSDHVLHVYIVPERTFRDWFGDQAYAVGVEELLCQGRACGAVTSGLYVTSTTSADALRNGISNVLGFGDPFQELGLPSPVRQDGGTTQP